MENFNIKRFGAYLASDAKSVWSKCSISLLVVVSMPVIQYFFNGIFRVLFGEEWSGQGYFVRLAVFCCVLLVTCIVFPAKAYGHITDKRAGSDFVLLPVSPLEKTLSMIILSCIAIPAIFLVGYGALDWLICVLDSSCGEPVFNLAVIAAKADEFMGPELLSNAAHAVLNPFVYLDDIVGLALFFLLGATFFKKSKVAKTILVYAGITIALSMITTPIMRGLLGSVSVTPDNLELFLEKFRTILEHPVLFDTINDTIVNLVLAVAVFFRVKTIKF